MVWRERIPLNCDREMTELALVLMENLQGVDV